MLCFTFGGNTNKLWEIGDDVTNKQGQCFKNDLPIFNTISYLYLSVFCVVFNEISLYFLSWDELHQEPC